MDINDLHQLSLQQLSGLKDDMQAELQGLTSNFSTLRDGAARYNESKLAVKALGSKAEGRQVLIPMTQSLYVSGKIVDPNKLLVEIGTGYYAEKELKETDEFLDRKVNMVQANLESLREVISQKRKVLEAVVKIMRMKIAQSKDA